MTRPEGPRSGDAGQRIGDLLLDDRCDRVVLVPAQHPVTGQQGIKQRTAKLSFIANSWNYKFCKRYQILSIEFR